MVVGYIQGILSKSRFARFVLVGGTSTVIDWGVFYILAVILAVYYQISLAVAFIVGASINYVLHKNITFRCESKKVFHQYFAFLAISSILLLLSVIIMFFLVELVSMDVMVSRISTTGLLLIVNYNLQRKFTFNNRYFS